MKDWMFLLYMLLWVFFTTVDFSFEIGDKNQVIIEKVQEKKEPKEETELKATW